MRAAVALALLGVLSPVNGDQPTLTRLDPASLRTTGPRLRLGEYHDNWSFSPDRRQVALGKGGAGDTCGRGVCIVDLDSLKIAGQIDAPTAVEAVAWLRPRRIVAVLQSGGILLADPVTAAIVRRVPLPFTAYAPPSARTPGWLAVVMAGRPSRLVVADARGDVRIARLRGIGRQAGLAIDRRGGRAFVFAAGSRAAEVDLRTMRVRAHRLAIQRPVRAPRGRVRTSYRKAVWLGSGRVAVFGDDQISGPVGTFRPSRSFAAGVHLVDTETWTARTLEPRAAGARLAAGRLVVYTPEGTSGAPGVGLRIYTRDGRRLVRHLFGNQALDIEVAGGRAYAYRRFGRARALRVVNARSGEVIRRVAPPPRGYDIDILGG